MPFNLPIFLTWLRILAIPLIVVVYHLPDGWLMPGSRDLAAVALFIAASATDWLDGYLARRLGQTSAFGAFLDPVADKLLVATALIMLVDLERASAVAAAIIIGREITISALREWMAQVGASKSVAVSLIGKFKTAAQMAAIALLLYAQPAKGLDCLRVGEALLWVAALLTLWSMGYYLKKAWPILAAGHSPQSPR
jgi:CDP-diacylglycerol--glycerol-3-phosphate 3-phosphatidyltransferase/cardiolipin synthase